MASITISQSSTITLSDECEIHKTKILILITLANIFLLLLFFKILWHTWTTRIFSALPN